MNWLIFILALIAVEAPKTDEAALKAEKQGYYGCLQITQAVLDDVNVFYTTDVVQWVGKPLSLEDCRDPFVSRWVCVHYLEYWGTHYTLETGKTPTYETMARIWNGGPQGYDRKATAKYWIKVEAEIKTAEAAVVPSTAWSRFMTWVRPLRKDVSKN